MMQRSLRLCSKSLFWRDFPHARLVVLNRESALNAMNMEMLKEMRRAYIQEPHPKGEACLFVLKGMGTKSFCAGGDVVSITKEKETAEEFFYREYQLNYHILTMPNTQVSLWNGYVMGGGVGVSVHGRYRVASERAVFAMPETAIGLFPDVGASWFLPRLKIPGVGLYLGLTGARLKGADLVHAGLATHYVPSASFEELEGRLCEVENALDVEACLQQFAVKDLPPFTLENDRKTLKDIFALREELTIQDIFGALSANGSNFAQATIELLKKMSPTSLCLCLEMLKRGEFLSDPAHAFSMDYTAAMRSCANSDFSEGVRALLVDKTKDPKWKPDTVAGVTTEHVASYFEPVTPTMRRWHPTKPY
ncbi:putative Enoyl CoA hydratase isomerase [Trypanosoma vivax]|nr:enoyl-CoA hydratase/isomerase family protein [Trypanosoma vivax]KAH8605084.1 putative Enoyl CoA hydratase isomerase [Trypanosoma vivax]